MYLKGQDGLKIAADPWGDLKDELVILLHGGWQTRHAWGETGPKLSKSGYHCIAIDLRGHGDSDWHPKGSYSIECYKQDLINIIKEIGKPASLIGASLGGMASLSLAGDKQNSNLCNALVMVDIGIYPDKEGSDRIVNFMLLTILNYYEYIIQYHISVFYNYLHIFFLQLFHIFYPIERNQRT